MTFSIRLKGNLEARLERLSESTDRPKAFYVNASLTLGLSIDALEEKYLPAHMKDGAQLESLGQESGKGLNLGMRQLSLA